MATEAGWSEDSVGASVRVGLTMDEDSVAPVVEALTPLISRLESGTGVFEVDRLVLCRFDAGSGVLLLGTSSSGMNSLLLFGFFDILYEMLLPNKHRSNV